MKKAVVIASLLVGLASLDSQAQTTPQSQNSRQNRDSTTSGSMNNTNNRRQPSTMQSDSGTSLPGSSGTNRRNRTAPNRTGTPRRDTT
ncbi:hypothetical protein [Spirosoma aerolatum]|uniref:hypothetical protein n=1 Tax=Spirosoma aerolatum TaxID=1211326 RepID=UPI0009AEC04B|nr:hypothetical protein [Spirosoma aerolatum]